MKIILSWRRRREMFRYPVEPVPRTAVLEPWFAAPERGSLVRMFASDAHYGPALERFAPQVLAGSWERLMRIARGSCVVPTHAVVVLHRDRGPLKAEDREWLWQAFRVPVYEQIIGPRGVLLASECAAHQGMHLMLDAGATDWNLLGCIERERCACGNAAPRLLAKLSPRGSSEGLRGVAAYAR